MTPVPVKQEGFKPGSAGSDLLTNLTSLITYTSDFCLEIVTQNDESISSTGCS